MTPFIIFCICLLFILAMSVLITSYVCFYRIFLSHRKKETPDEVFENDTNLAPFAKELYEWRDTVAALPYREVQIKSFDGLTLKGRYYEYEKGAPIELLMHGYRGSMKRDMDAGIIRCFMQGRNAFCVDHRACGESEGRVITFGINESRDCADWVSFIISNIDENAKIILTGVSMGAATVMIAAGRELPENVVGVIADCGYTSAKEIITKTMTEMKSPPKLLYPFATLGGLIFGGFNINKTSPLEMMKKAKLPIIFLHGDADTFVPFDMSVQNFNACTSEKKELIKIENAAHGIAFLENQEKYLNSLTSFFDGILK